MKQITYLEESRATFFCPGCKLEHSVVVKQEGAITPWGWNGSIEKPTFTPSILTWGGGIGGREDATGRCHSFVTDGNIQFLSDCTHSLAGQTVPLEEF